MFRGLIWLAMVFLGLLGGFMLLIAFTLMANPFAGIVMLGLSYLCFCLLRITNQPARPRW
jgi:hypothetical protein